MPTLEIDGRTIKVTENATILEAAECLGIHIPTLCYAKGYAPGTSCMVCVVEVKNQNRLLPACATPVCEGMIVRTDTEEVQEARKTALELILSDHVGDCQAPCEVACPAGFQIPQFLRLIACGKFEEAGTLAMLSLILPQTLSAICPSSCKKICRRGHLDDGQLSVDVNRLHGLSFLYDTLKKSSGLAGDSQSEIEQNQKEEKRKTIRIIGAGPSGLAAAFVLSQKGYDIVLSERGLALAQSLRERAGDVCVDNDLGLWMPSERICVRVQDEMNENDPQSWFQLRQSEFNQTKIDFVVVACGKAGRSWKEALPDAVKTRVAFCGEARHGCGQMAVRAIADGVHVAHFVDRLMNEELDEQTILSLPSEKVQHRFSVHMGTLFDEEKRVFRHLAGEGAEACPQSTSAENEIEKSKAEAARCLHCDCRAADNCKLRLLAEEMGARARAYLPHPIPHADGGGYNVHSNREHVAADENSLKPHRKIYRIDTSHADILYEPGKCILCGLCIQVAQNAGEALGHAFLGRGFSVQVGSPLHEPLEQALRTDPNACVKICPTGALSFRDDCDRSEKAQRNNTEI